MNRNECSVAACRKWVRLWIQLNFEHLSYVKAEKIYRDTRQRGGITQVVCPVRGTWAPCANKGCCFSYSVIKTWDVVCESNGDPGRRWPSSTSPVYRHLRSRTVVCSFRSVLIIKHNSCTCETSEQRLVQLRCTSSGNKNVPWNHLKKPVKKFSLYLPMFYRIASRSHTLIILT